jgi:hypothetical protein
MQSGVMIDRRTVPIDAIRRDDRQEDACPSTQSGVMIDRARVTIDAIARVRGNVW